MRCRKVRSFLSAYCNNELSNRRKLAVSEHLSTCSACRREEAVYQSISLAGKELPKLAVVNDFNNKLLNRLAHQRFAETRTRAYLPKRAPVVYWQRAIPAFVTTCLMILLAVVAFSPQIKHQSGLTANKGILLDDSYLTAQPVSNANMTVNLKKGWSLSHQLAQTERMNRISRVIIQQAAWGDVDRPYGLMTASSRTSMPLPYMPNYYKVRSVVRTYMFPESPSDKEVGKAY